MQMLLSLAPSLPEMHGQQPHQGFACRHRRDFSKSADGLVSILHPTHIIQPKPAMSGIPIKLVAFRFNYISPKSKVVHYTFIFLRKRT